MNIKKQVARIIGIQYCYNCGKCIWWSKQKLRYYEDSKSNGFLAPVCQECLTLSEHYSNLSHE